MFKNHKFLRGKTRGWRQPLRLTHALRVYIQNVCVFWWHHAHMCFNMCEWCRHKRVRFGCTHGDVFSVSHHTTVHTPQHHETQHTTTKAHEDRERTQIEREEKTEERKTRRRKERREMKEKTREDERDKRSSRDQEKVVVVRRGISFDKSALHLSFAKIIHKLGRQFSPTRSVGTATVHPHCGDQGGVPSEWMVGRVWVLEQLGPERMESPRARRFYHFHQHAGPRRKVQVCHPEVWVHFAHVKCLVGWPCVTRWQISTNKTRYKELTIRPQQARPFACTHVALHPPSCLTNKCIMFMWPIMKLTCSSNRWKSIRQI